MEKEISIELVNSIAFENLSTAGRDLAEVAVDSVLKEGVLRDIPVFNTLAALYRAGVEVRQQIFTKKVVNFLKELSNTPFEQRRKFVKDIEQDISRKPEFGETLLLLIDRADSLQKPSILGRLIKHHILGDISYEDATRLAFIVDRVYISDLKYLLNFAPGIQHSPDIAASLQSVGILTFTGIDSGTFNAPLSGGLFYELNKYGQMLLEYGLEKVS